jgi:uncharacterized membrane protein YgcG
MHMVNGRLEDAAAVPALKWHDTPMWRGLEGMRIEPPGAALSFVERLGADNGWDECFAESVYRQYLRFLYLSATSQTPLTPSDAVDQAWHLHLAYSRHYWDVLCGEILRRPFHHGPTAGGRDESAKYRAQYDDTLERYRAVFGEEPPADIWPPVSRRFAARGVRVDRTEAWVVPKRVTRAAAALAGATAVTAACSADGLGGVERLLVLLILVVLGLALLHQFLPGSRRRRKDGGCSGYSGDSDGGGDGDGGGCGGCGGD